MILYLCVLDLEATCGKHTSPEIIEFSSVMLRWEKNEITEIGQFQQFVRPSIHPVVSLFCEKLTGITQGTVNKGASLKETVAKHLKWIRDITNSKDVKDIRERVMIVTCGAWDIEMMLPADLERNNLDTDPVYEQYVNAKDLFSTVTGIRTSKSSMTEMMKYYDLELKGRHHSGIDDSRNISRIITEMIKQGLTLEVFIEHIKK
ncbi:exonuclease [Yasminevirus sp. GU-2018]|uniref:Exonuclease n=1 Tax=Yasminevirus sp. GU-2018 TaxID=2420051 RepID=A0A5K0U6J5_9VIRU|nr:exonuclease [Yasminevirus sp. GU-2018]